MIFLSALTTMALISASGGTTAGAAASGGTAISNGATDSGVGVSGPAVSGGTKGDETIPGRKKTATAYFGTGCFWCTEAVFQELKGVEKVTSGYSGGSAVNPSYEEVCTGTTGHAECLRVVYDPAVITYDELLEVFWEVHDPTTLNRQGNDVGTQYRSVIFFENAEQKQKAEHYKEELNKTKAYDKPIVTEITAFTKFYPAEDYHQNYFNTHGTQPYCSIVIRPKVDKFEKVFAAKLKKKS